MIGVTAFGIFLTPVFFYVLQGLDESRFLAGEGVQRIGAYVIGALSGLAFGYLAARIADLSIPWSLGVGGSTGFLGAVVLFEIHKRLRSPAPPRIIAHAGLPAPSSTPPGHDTAEGGSQS
jgi:multidrug efflux pump